MKVKEIIKIECIQYPFANKNGFHSKIITAFWHFELQYPKKLKIGKNINIHAILPLKDELQLGIEYFE